MLGEENKRRKQVSGACSPCRKRHSGCDESRPCKQCIKRGSPSLCEDHPRKKRKVNRWIPSGNENSAQLAKESYADIQSSNISSRIKLQNAKTTKITSQSDANVSITTITCEDDLENYLSSQSFPFLNTSENLKRIQIVSIDRTLFDQILQSNMNMKSYITSLQQFENSFIIGRLFENYS